MGKNKMKTRILQRLGLLALVVLLVSILPSNITPQEITSGEKSGFQKEGRSEYFKEGQGIRGTKGKARPEVQYVPGEVIVKLKEQEEPSTLFNLNYSLRKEKSELTLSQLKNKYNLRDERPVFKAMHRKLKDENLTQGEYIEEIRSKYPERQRRAPKQTRKVDLLPIYVVKTDDDVLEVCDRLKKDPQIKYAQPNYIYKTNMVPNDPYYHSSGTWDQDYDDLWALKDDKLNMEPAWNITQGEGVVVAVIDTGLDEAHPDAPVNIVAGWDFIDDDQTSQDGNGHGTHVSGTIAARSNNNQGIIGIAPQAQIMPIRALDDFGYSTSEILAEALEYAALQGAEIVNNSWGPQLDFLTPGDPLIEQAVLEAYDFGAIIVFAAGNASLPVFYVSPQNMRETITVASTDHWDEASIFSNFGPEIDLAAPGGDSDSSPILGANILSLRAEGTDMYGDAYPEYAGDMVVDTWYYRTRGTSMAAPHVSGLAALILANNPSFTNEDVRQVLRASCDDVQDPGFDFATGFGRINAGRALEINEVPQVAILTPALYEAFNAEEIDTLYITGTAAGPGFQQYQLFHTTYSAIEEWEPITEPVFSPVENGLLATWSLEGGEDFDEKFHIFKLVVLSSQGLEFQDLVMAYVFREKNVRQITDNPDTQLYPDISGNYIVWDDARNGYYSNRDIFLYDLATNTESRITPNPANQFWPVVSGNYVAWFDMRNGRTDIYLYDITTGQEQQITNELADIVARGPRSIDISGNYIVWADRRNGNRDIYFYDIETGQEQQITVDPEMQYAPSVSGSRIVWMDARNASGRSETDNWDIYFYDIATGQEEQITTDSHSQRYPNIGERYIAWEDRRTGNVDPDIFVYDLNAELEQQVTSDGFYTRPVVSGNSVAYERYQEDIYLYCLDAGKQTLITSHPDVQSDPAISGKRIVWHDRRNGAHNNTFDIYLYEPPPVPVWVDANGNGDYTDIQSAVNAASDGDEICVVQGTYTGSGDSVVSLYSRNLILKGGYTYVNGSRNPQLYPTIIDGENQRRCVFTAALSSNSELSGLILERGSAEYDWGGGMSNVQSDLKITDCIFRQNSAYYGGGMDNSNNSNPLIVNCIFKSNSGIYGGGVFNSVNSAPELINCIFISNKGRGGGGGIYNSYSNPVITNCTFASNSGINHNANAVYNVNSSPVITNTILWDGGNEIFDGSDSSPLITYSDIQGGYPGEGNINANPLFTNAGTSELHLAGLSPCVDSGNPTAAPETDMEGIPRPQGSQVDMGVYERAYDPTTYGISGHVYEDRTGLAGVTIVIVGNGRVITDSNGSYEKLGLPNGVTYTLIPSKEGYAFEPESQQIDINGSDVAAEDFIATATVHSIRGHVTLDDGVGVEGVTVEVEGPVSGSDTTDSDGYYEVNNLPNGNYSITPTKSEYTFIPLSCTVEVNNGDKIVDFTAIQNTYCIIGHVRMWDNDGEGVEGVNVEITGPVSGTTITNSIGQFTMEDLPNGTYAVIPTKPGLVIHPISHTAIIDGGGANGGMFIATPPTYSISGYVKDENGQGVSRVNVTITRPGSTWSVSSWDNGYYTKNDLSNGAYTVTPSLPECTFIPESQTVEISDSTVTVPDFTIIIPAQSISGYVTFRGVPGNIVNNGVTVYIYSQQAQGYHGYTTMYPNGFYIKTDLPNDTYDVIPALPQCLFIPESRTVGICNGSEVDQDFIGTYNPWGGPGGDGVAAHNKLPWAWDDKQIEIKEESQQNQNQQTVPQGH